MKKNAGLKVALLRGKVLLKVDIFQPGNVELSIYNTTGGLVRVLMKERLQPGVYFKIWDGLDSKGNRTVNGIYFYRLTVNGKSVSAKAMLLQ